MNAHEMAEQAIRDDAAATRGPWKHETEDVLDDYFIYRDGLLKGPVLFAAMAHSDVPYLANAAWVATARTSLHALARAYLAAEKVVEAARNSVISGCVCAMCRTIAAHDAELAQINKEEGTKS